MSANNKMESEREETKTPEDSYNVWDRELKAAKKHYERYWEISNKIQKRYRDERRDSPDGGTLSSLGSKINLFWSNTQVLKSTLYTKPPKVDVARIFKDSDDDIARVAGIILERLLNTDLEKDQSDFDVAARQGIDDWLIVGQAQIWYRYDAEIVSEPAPPPIDPMTGQPQVDPITGAPLEALDEQGQPAMVERVANEDALSDYVYWKDFLCSPARTWQEVRWVGRRVYMTRDALVDRFGDDIGEDVPLYSRNSLGEKTTSEEASTDDPWATAEVWEIWCKTNKKVYWCTPGHDKFLDQRDDPLELEGFFPCPEPMIANKTNNTLIPRADFSMARDQYQQIDILATRLRMLVDACKVRGVYDKENASMLANVLAGDDNKMIPVDSWAMFAEKGGLKGAMDWVPIEQIAATITILRQDLAEQKQELYETLGIADIMRGATRASETATAQQIKAQFGSTRLQFKQFEVGRFVRDAQRIKAGIICGHYQPETMKTRSNIMHTPDAALADQAIALLQSEGCGAYRIVIEADSMAALDWAAEREKRTEFMSALGGFIQQVMPLAQAKPESTPVLLQMMKWGLGGFRIGKEIEGVLDQALQEMAASPSGPDPIEKEQQQANLDKTKSESAKNIASADKTAAEAGTSKLQNATDAQIMGAMGAQVPPMDSAQEASYAPEPQQPPPGGAI